MLTNQDLQQLEYFLDKYPTWWYTIGVCDVSRDFTCAPQAHSPEAQYIESGNDFDCGFSCDHEGSVADAIKDVMSQIGEALSEVGFPLLIDDYDEPI